MIFLPVFLTFINLHSVVKYFQKVLINRCRLQERSPRYDMGRRIIWKVTVPI